MKEPPAWTKRQPRPAMSGPPVTSVAVPREILYENMKTAFNRDSKGRWKANKHQMRLANH